eukprot:CAMPEP_0198218478 /NCGR_PEP_ID=MMETSP1445-20131203/69516_1 /TAXON_ID=36898 /ORGANISM="Pyramimonas sp., Strain CCMP2087" /LENGTH=308 /DNA_ID=CAMNT_0043895521 /DNA_START=71 /DNA_END=997 /DNA_ORIENTATION=+
MRRFFSGAGRATASKPSSNSQSSPPPPPPPPPPHLKVLYQTPRLCAIDKPHKMLVHRSPIDKRETLFAVQTLRDQLGGQRVFPLHRLDKATSGVLLFALDSLAASEMNVDESRDKVEKTYIALVRGWVDIQMLKEEYYNSSNYRVWYDEATVDVDNLDDAADPATFTLNYPLQVIDERTGQKTDKSQDAVTTIKLLEKCEFPYPCGKYSSIRYSLVELGLRTGRTHQLRKHLRHLNHPIIGDSTHGDLRQNQCFYENVLNNKRQMFLRAKKMKFEDPFEGSTVELDAGLGENWELLAQAVPAFREFVE